MTPRANAAEALSASCARPTRVTTNPLLLRRIIGPLRTSGLGAKIANTVRVGGKANQLNASARHAGRVAMALALALAFELPLPMCAGLFDTAQVDSARVKSSRAKMLHAGESYNGQTVTLEPGQLLELSLAENPTTGFRWHFAEPATAEDGPHCLLVKDSYEPGNPHVAGQGGTHRWQFQAGESGACTIELEYRRTWEKGKPPERTFRLHVEVRKGVQDIDPAKPSG